MNLSLDLNALKYANVGSSFVRNYGTQKIANGGSLTTKEFDDAIFMPFDKQRPVVVTENVTVTKVEYDAKLVLNASALTVTLGTTVTEGLKLTIVALYDWSLIANGDNTPQSMKAGIYTWQYNGTKWVIIESNLSYNPFVICDTAASTQTKAVTDVNIPALTKGQRLTILFTNGSTVGTCVGTSVNTIAETDAPKISLNGGTAYPIKIGGEFAGENFVRSGDVHTFIFDGNYWHDLDAELIYQGSTTDGNYQKKRDGLIEQSGTKEASRFTDNWCEHNFIINFTHCSYFNFVSLNDIRADSNYRHSVYSDDKINFKIGDQNLIFSSTKTYIWIAKGY